MIINVEREPNLSLYYLGGILLTLLKKKKELPIEEVILEIKESLRKRYM